MSSTAVVHDWQVKMLSNILLTLETISGFSPTTKLGKGYKQF